MPNKRKVLIEAVQYGRMTPDEADSEASRMGLEPLSYRPNPADYDPILESLWTPAMAVAWILWRTRDAVRGLWADYTRQCRVWRFKRWRVGQDVEVHEGAFLEEPERPSLSLLYRMDVAPHELDPEVRATYVPLRKARDELLMALRAGLIGATGVLLPGSLPRQEIATVQWLDLEFVYDDGEDRFHREGSLGRDGYRDVLLLREEVLRLWKSGPPLPPQQLPSIVRPDGPGYMTVFHALLWIATAGGAETFDIADGERWQRAFDALWPRVASGDVLLTGEGDGERVVIAPHVVAACPFNGPGTDQLAGLLFGTYLYLRSYPYIDEDRWRIGIDDALLVGQQERWTRLMVPKEAVGTFWPFQLAIPTRSGAPGRPSSMYLVVEEFERRVAVGLLSGTLAEHAEALSHWVRKAHPTAPPPSPKTIKNRIRHAFNAARKA